jgi:hypothetical protein
VPGNPIPSVERMVVATEITSHVNTALIEGAA